MKKFIGINYNFKDDPGSVSWYLYKMVTQNMISTYDVKSKKFI